MSLLLDKTKRKVYFDLHNVRRKDNVQTGKTIGRETVAEVFFGRGKGGFRSAEHHLSSPARE